MKGQILEIRDKLTHIGASYISDNHRVSQLISFNTTLLVGIFIFILSLSTNIITLTWTAYDTIIYFGGFSSIAFFLLLNALGKFKISTVMAHIAFSLLFCAGALTSGVIFICCLMNLLWMVISFRFLESPKERLILSGLQLIFVNATIFVAAHLHKDVVSSAYIPIERSIVYSLIFGFLYFIIKRVTDQSRKDFDQINQLVLELEQKNENIERNNMKLKRAYDELERFSHIISHDLKTPLRNMNTYASLLQRDVQNKKDSKVLEYSDNIRSNGLKLTNMINDVLAYSKLNAFQNSKRELIQLKEIIVPIKNSLKQIYPNSEVELKSDGKLFSSSTKLTMLFQNLIENGLKYNKSTNKKVTVYFNSKQRHNVITVTDNGIGIPEEYQEQIFKLFSRLHSDGEFEGTGIGLSTCKKIVEEHLNGELTVSSIPNKGTTFKIIVPA